MDTWRQHPGLNTSSAKVFTRVQRLFNSGLNSWFKPGDSECTFCLSMDVLWTSTWFALKSTLHLNAEDLPSRDATPWGPYSGFLFLGHSRGWCNVEIQLRFSMGLLAIQDQGLSNKQTCRSHLGSMHEKKSHSLYILIPKSDLVLHSRHFCSQELLKKGTKPNNSYTWVANGMTAPLQISLSTNTPSQASQMYRTDQVLLLMDLNYKSLSFSSSFFIHYLTFFVTTENSRKRRWIST